MIYPLFWLGFSLLLVAVSLTAVLVVALPALRELARAARSAEKLFDTLNRELPPTLEALRLTGLEISNLTDDMSEGVQNAGRVVQQLDQSVNSVRQQARQAQVVTNSVVAGFQAAWRSFTRPVPRRDSHHSEPTLGDEQSYPSQAELASDFEQNCNQYLEPDLDQELDQDEFEQAELESR